MINHFPNVQILLSKIGIIFQQIERSRMIVLIWKKKDPEIIPTNKGNFLSTILHNCLNINTHYSHLYQRMIQFLKFCLKQKKWESSGYFTREMLDDMKEKKRKVSGFYFLLIRVLFIKNLMITKTCFAFTIYSHLWSPPVAIFLAFRVWEAFGASWYL